MILNVCDLIFYLFQNMLDDAKQIHSEQLTAMRIPDKKVMLKPVAKANNPIVRKRILTRY